MPAEFPSHSAAGFAGAWATLTHYTLNSIVTSPDGSLQAAKLTHTSTTIFDQTKWTKISDGTVSTQLRDPIFGSQPAVASRSGRVGAVNGNGHLTGNCRSQHICSATCTDVRVVFPGYAYDTLDSAQQMTITAGIEYPLGTTVYPVFFEGLLAGKVDPGGIIVSDPVGIDLTKGDAFYVRTFITVASTTGGWLTNYLTISGRNEGGSLDGTDLSKVTTGIVSAPTVAIFVPLAILGLPTATTYPPVIGLVGDSIMKGDLDPDEIGYALRSMNDGYAWIDVARGGETVQTAATVASYQKRIRALANCTHAVCNYGNNDLPSRTVAQVQANLLSVLTRISNRGVKTWQSTFGPRTTSTDSFATTANQTVAASESKRVQMNAWIRAGAPIDPSTKAAVAVGTVGALIAGQTGHPLQGYFEMFATVEVNAANTPTQDGGLWKVDGTASKYTSDGLHPSTASHILMAPAFDTSKFI